MVDCYALQSKGSKGLSFVPINSLTPEMDLACKLSVKDQGGALAFRPDFLAAISLSRDQMSARTDYTWDTDAVSGECFDSWPHKKGDITWKAPQMSTVNIVQRFMEWQFRMEVWLYTPAL